MDPTSFSPPTFPAGANYVNPRTLAPAVVGISASFTSLSFVAVVLNVWTRVKLHGKLVLADIFVVVALFLAILMTFCMIWATKYGLGRYWADIPVPWILPGYNKFPQALYLTSLFYLASLTFIKLAVLMFYTQLIPTLRFQQASYIVMFIVAGMGIGIMFSFIFACSPIWASWDFASALLTDVKCMNVYAIYMSAAILCSITDLIVLFMPTKSFFSTKMDCRKRGTLLVAFGLAAVGVLMGLIRIGFYHKMGKNKVEYNYYGAIQSILGSLEVNIAIVVCCLPAIHSLFTRRFPQGIFSASTKNQPMLGGTDSQSCGVFSTTQRSGIETSRSKKGKQPRSSEDTLPRAVITTKIYDARTEHNVYKASVKGARMSGQSRRGSRKGSWCFGCDTESLEMIESNDGEEMTGLAREANVEPGVIAKRLDFSIRFEDAP